MSNTISPFSDVKLFEEFYLENKKKILIQSKSYNIDEKNFSIYINSYNTPYTKFIVNLFRKYTKHISLNTFYEKLGSICASIFSTLDSLELQNIIILLPNFEEETYTKSNFWTTMIVYGILRERAKLIDICYHQDIDKKYSEDEIKKSLFVVCDDASYSGIQLKSNVMRRLLTIQKEKKINVFFAIPYISQSAKTLLSQYSPYINIIFSSETEIFNTFRENIAKDKYGEEISAIEIIDKHRIDGDKKHTIYFDHKLADTVSIFQSQYAIGCNLFEDYELFDTKGPISLIENCDLPSQLKDQEYPFDSCSTLDIKDVVSEMCPPALYKYIKYTFRGKEL